VRARQQRLDEAMSAAGAWPERSPWIREAVRGAPRHAFAPDRLWRWDGQTYRPLDRAVDADAWADALYAGPYDAAVTELADGLPASSMSCPSIVADMLDALRLEPGHRVLELGTGTGWNAGLLAHRAGPGRVSTVDIDDTLTARARPLLGAGVTVVTGDGAKGWAGQAPYDRVVCTYAVDTVPWAWVEQTRPGGRIVTPWGRLGHVALTVAEDGESASGRVRGLAQFMPARDRLAPVPPYAEVHDASPVEQRRPFPHDLALLRDDWNLRFALRVALPELHTRVAEDDDGVNAWIHDGTSWAMLAAGRAGATAFQGGPRRLADELGEAWAHWVTLGAPSLYDYGLTVRSGEQYVWVHDPADGTRRVTG
jgi:protein-L-isoaspartate(D-aspartate) O-methyltransferase